FLVGPLTPGPAVSDVHNFEVMAEIGVALLMFSIGIELSLKDLLAVRRLALVGAPLGLAAFIGLTTAVALALGWSMVAGVSLGMVLCVQSTMVAARLLMDRGETGSRHGRVGLRARPAGALPAAAGHLRRALLRHDGHAAGSGTGLRAPGTARRSRGAGRRRQPRRLDGRRAPLRRVSLERGPDRRGAHADRRVLLRPRPGGAPRRPRGRRRLQRDARRLAPDDPDQRAV